MVGKPTVTDIPRSVLREAFGTDLQFARDLASLTSLQTGGPASYFLIARSAGDLVRAIQAAARLNIPVFVMGGGSNLLVSDDGFDGLVIKFEITGLKLVDSSTVESRAGERLVDLVDFATEHSLSGLEFAAGIWGTVGGAIYGNAGAYGGEIGNRLEKATLVDQRGELKEVPSDYFQFGYRHSCLKETREVVVSAWFSLRPGDREEIKNRVDDILLQRAQRHPDKRTAGCFFRNVPDDSREYGKQPAGYLLEEAGAKELKVGGAEVYPKHANIIVNTGNATSKDIRRLADMMKQRVLDRFGIELQEEIQQLGSIQ